MITNAYAHAATGTPAPAGNPLGSFIPLILIFVVFYFLLIRPQQKKEKERKSMINALKKGDQVVTTGGIYGTVITIKADTIDIKVDENTRLVMAKNSIVTVVNPNADTTAVQ